MRPSGRRTSPQPGVPRGLSASAAAVSVVTWRLLGECVDTSVFWGPSSVVENVTTAGGCDRWFYIRLSVS